LDSWESDGIYITDILDPRILAARSSASKYNEDNPSWDTATKGPFQAEFWQAMRVELNTLVSKFKCWDLVPQLPHMNVLPSTWAFKIKHFPDGSVKKFKACFCACGDHQKEGIDFFETWAPVLQWSTIRIVMVLAAKLGLHSVQCDITAAFIPAFLLTKKYTSINHAVSNVAMAPKYFASGELSMDFANHHDIFTNISLSVWSSKDLLCPTLTRVYFSVPA
jgi:hypothetical protein